MHDNPYRAEGDEPSERRVRFQFAPAMMLSEAALVAIAVFAFYMLVAAVGSLVAAIGSEDDWVIYIPAIFVLAMSVGIAVGMLVRLKSVGGAIGFVVGVLLAGLAVGWSLWIQSTN